MSNLAYSVVTSSRYREAEATKTPRRQADKEQKCQKREATRDAYRAANQLRMPAGRALEWIRM